VSDASVIASAVDMTIIVVQHRRFPRSMMLRVKQALVNVGANIIGCVLNNTDTRHDEYYEYYTSYYQYYSPDKSANISSKPSKTPKSGGAAATDVADQQEGEY
jgi:Mrp family chromosome partitioning ATPase